MIGPSDSADSEIDGDRGVNPYQAPTSMAPPEPSVQQRSPLGMTRGGRRSLLQSVFFMRFSAVVNALLWGRSLLTWLRRPFDVYSEFGAERLRIIVSPAVLISGSLAITTGVVFLYLNLLLWRYAQHVKDRAAGRENDDADICQAHLRFWKMDMVALLLVVTSDIVGYVIQWQAAQAPGS